MRVGIIGCGSIGSAVAKAIGSTVIYDADHRKALDVARKCNALAVESFDELMRQKPDVVLEAASQEAVRMYGKRVVERADLVVMSAGAFADPEFFREIVETARKSSRYVIVPSGAIAGIDAIKSVAHHVDEVVLITRKNPQSFGIETEKKKTIFEGSVLEAVKLYPKNVNVAGVLGIAVGIERVKVRIIADPEVSENIHQIRARGKFGEIRVEVINRPIPGNPKTSYLAALSAIAVLRRLRERGGVVVGT